MSFMHVPSSFSLLNTIHHDIICLLWVSTGIILPGVYDDGQLWKTLKALIPVHVSLVLNTSLLRSSM